MICGIERIIDLSAPVATTPSTPAALPSPSRGYGGGRSSQHSSAPMAQNICFKCNQPGHWRNNCPFKWRGPEKPPPPSPDLPIVRCHCGRACSKTELTTGREVYKCSKCHTEIPVEDVRTIICPCGAGAAALNVRMHHKFGAIKFYACRIKKGLGACGFLELENPSVRQNQEIMALVLDRVKGQLSQEERLEISSLVNHCEAESSTRDLVVEEVENSFPIMEEQATNIFGFRSRWEIHNRQMEFDSQISAAAMESSTLKGGSGVQSLCLSDTGWLGRLAFPPRRSLAEYLAEHIFCLCKISTLDCIHIPDLVDTSKSSSSPFVVQHVPTHAELDWVTPESSASVAPENGIVFRPSNPKRSFSELQEDHSTRSKVKNFGEKLQKELAMILQSLEQFEIHASKKDVQGLPRLINFEGDILQAELSSLVRKNGTAYHNSRARLKFAISQLEVQLQVGESSNFTGDSWFDSVCSIHAHAMAAFTASDEQLQLFNKHMFTIKDSLLRIGNQLQACQSEILKIEAHAMETSRMMVQAKTTLMAASQHLLGGPKSYHQSNEDPRSSGQPAEICLTSDISSIVHERKRQKLGNFPGTSQTKFGIS